VCQFSLVAGLRTSQPIRNSREREEAERILADRRQRILHAVTRMNGGRGIPETLAQKRIFIGTLPGLAEETKRELECLTLHAADLLPVELPWQGTTDSPGILLETPSRQMVPFSPFDPGLGDANMLIMAKSGGGKTFMAQLLLLMLARSNAQISILERGDSYKPLVDLMGGRVIEVSLDGNETINPFDLSPGEKAPSKEKIAFLKNLTQHMIGASPNSDMTLVESVLSDAIVSTYKRCSMRYANPIPTFSDLRDELAQWRDEEKMQRTIDEARLASVKLRTWTEGGIYSRLFDRHTNIRTDNNWLFFNVEGLSSDPKLETAMSMLIAHAMAERASGRSGQPSVTVLDECWSLLDSPTLAPEVVQLFRTARKRNSSVWGISQTLEDFVGSSIQPRLHGPGIVKNANTKLIGQQPGDLSTIQNQLHLNEVALGAIKRFSSPQKGRYAEMLLVIGEKSETTQAVRLVPTPIDYWICTTYPRERIYRAWFLWKHKDRPLFESYEELAQQFPQGLAGLERLAEEVSGEVSASEAVVV
jgi:type IV secretory pathway VirB4 component